MDRNLVLSLNLRPASREERQLALLWLFAAASSLVLRPIWLAVAPSLGPCVFKSLTGIPCPTCGTTRAATAFLNGDLLTAFIANPLAALAAVVFVAGGVVAGVWAIARWPIPKSTNPLPVWTRVMAIGIIVTNWIYLIARS